MDSSPTLDNTAVKNITINYYTGRIINHPREPCQGYQEVPLKVGTVPKEPQRRRVFDGVEMEAVCAIFRRKILLRFLPGKQPPPSSLTTGAGFWHTVRPRPS
ncbi:hypothetical protein KEM48_012375 [Puccinia striiformis f. sp. tritici PST-130]|nr:hypothetical protein KEM48_012375 [Puccinia striiformis f. sp. tritici PST-130]